MNNWSFTGNLGGNAEMRALPDGTPVAQFSVATTSGFGEKKVTSWVRCSFFGARAEKVAPYIIKGDRIGVTGEVKLHEWTARDGAVKTSLEVRVNDITLLGDPSQRQAAPQQAPQQQAPQQAAPQQQSVPHGTSDSSFDDDIPFN